MDEGFGLTLAVPLPPVSSYNIPTLPILVLQTGTHLLNLLCPVTAFYGMVMWS